MFLHKVLDGPSDQSYGINVASLAKLPIDVTLRAKDILNKLEQKTYYDQEDVSLKNYQKPIIKYIEKENPKHVKIIEYLSNLEVNNMKPLDALIELSKIKEELENEQ